MPPNVKENILLVEGADDLYVTANIWEKHGLAKKHIQIEDMKGVDELLKDLKGFFEKVA